MCVCPSVCVYAYTISPKEIQYPDSCTIKCFQNKSVSHCLSPHWTTYTTAASGPDCRRSLLFVVSSLLILAPNNLF